MSCSGVRRSGPLPPGPGLAGGVEQVLGIALLQSFQGERRPGAVAQQALPPRVVGGLDTHRRVDGEPAAVWPRVHRMRSIAIEPTAAHKARHQAAAHGGLHRSDGFGVDPAGRVEDDTRGWCGREHPVEHHAMKMQMRVERRAETVDERHRPVARCGTRTRTVRAQGLLHRALRTKTKRANPFDLPMVPALSTDILVAWLRLQNHAYGCHRIQSALMSARMSF